MNKISVNMDQRSLIARMAKVKTRKTWSLDRTNIISMMLISSLKLQLLEIETKFWASRRISLTSGRVQLLRITIFSAQLSKLS